MIKAVLIDVDDTILDFDLCGEWAMKESAKEENIALCENTFSIFHEINDSLWKALERKEVTIEELFILRWEKTFAKLNIKADCAKFDTLFAKNLANSTIPVEGIKEILPYLSKKYKIYIASNGIYEQQTNRLALAHLSKYISDYFVSKKIGFSKPSFEFYDYCFTHMNIENKEEVIMIGDSISADVNGAHNYGFKTIWFNRLNEDKTCENADYIISKISEIKQIL